MIPNNCGFYQNQTRCNLDKLLYYRSSKQIKTFVRSLYFINQLYKFKVIVTLLPFRSLILSLPRTVNKKSLNYVFLAVIDNRKSD